MSEKMDVGINKNGANYLFGIINNNNEKMAFLKQKYKLLTYTLKNSILYEIDNSYFIPPHMSNMHEYKNQVLFYEMNRIFGFNYQKQSIKSLYSMVERKTPFVLSEIGSVFGIKNQKSLFGFLNEKNDMYYLESANVEVKLDFTFCRNSFGYIVKGGFVAVTGVLKGTKFVVFEIVLPQSGFFLSDSVKNEIKKR